MKRGFRYEPDEDKYVAPLELATIHELPYWMYNNETPEEITLQNFEQALEEASLHGQEVFEQHYMKMRESLFRLMKLLPKFGSLETNLGKVRMKYLDACLSKKEIF